MTTASATAASSAPTVSVVVPAYNGVRWLPDTLNSLAAQTFADWEAIVIDDGSTDGTRAMVAGWPDARIRLLPMANNGGPVVARNAGVAAARGRYIAGLDQDDLCRPERLARQVAYLGAHPGCALVGTAVEILDGDTVRPSTYPATTTPDLIAWLLGIGNPLAWSSVMLRADLARRLRPFTRPDLVYAEDFDLYHRIAKLGGIARIDTPLVLYRQHAGGVSKRFVDTMRLGAIRVLAERHAALGEDAQRAATLLVRHNMGGVPVPHRATLVELGQVFGALQATFVQQVRPDAASRRLIRWETARCWARIGRAGLRAGTLTLADVLAVRPPHLGLGYAGLEVLASAGLVGGARRAKKTLGQTLAAKIIRPAPSRENT